MNNVIINGVSYVPATVLDSVLELASRVERLAQEVNLMVEPIRSTRAPVILTTEPLVALPSAALTRNAQKTDEAFMRAYRESVAAEADWTIHTISESAGITKSQAYHAAQRLLRARKIDLARFAGESAKLWAIYNAITPNPKGKKNIWGTSRA